MKTISRYIMTLALLLTAVTGAWAISDPNAVYWDYQTWKGWAENVTTHTVGDITITATGSGKAYESTSSGEPLALQAGANDAITFTSNGKPFASIAIMTDDELNVAGWTYNSSTRSYKWSGEPTTSVTLSGCDINADYIIFTFGTAEAPITVEPVTGQQNQWTFAMPGSDVVLTPIYAPTKVTLAANDVQKGSVEVAGESKVEWTADTWKGWTADIKEYTVDDITMTSSESAHIREYTSENESNNSLFFFVRQMIDDATVTFSTTGDPFSRIEFTMIGDYSERNPNIIPNDNWTFEGKSAVWEGEATKSLTLQSCSTNVSKITFYKGAAIPDGVTVNTDGTFTVAQTATVKVKAIPAEGYKLKGWSDAPDCTDLVREITIEPGEEDMIITAIFEEMTYTATFTAANANTIEAGKATVTVAGAAATVTDGKLEGVKMGSEVKLEAKPGYKFRKVEVKKAASAPSLNITNPVVGQVIGSDGKNYDADATLPSGVTKVAMITYVGSETGHDTYKSGLAIALRDEGEMDWATAKSTCEAKSAFTNAAWMVPSVPQWMAMCLATANDGNAYYGGMKYAMIAAAGEESSFKEDGYQYWSSSETSSSTAYCFGLKDDTTIFASVGKDNIKGVRAVLAF